MTSISEHLAGLRPRVREISAKTAIPLDRLEAIGQGAEPTVGELRRLAAALDVSVSDLLPHTETQQKAVLLFRTTVAKKRKHPPASVDRLAGFVGRALDVLPSDGKPSLFPTHFQAGEKTYSDAEAYAYRFRELFAAGDQVSPVPSLPHIAVTQLGILLHLVDSSEFEGASAIVDREPFVFLARRSFTPRMLFTLAHELGHLVAWRPGDDDFAVVDLATDIERVRPAHRRQEWFADAFASCLLLPRAGVGIALKKIRALTQAQGDALGDVELLYLARIFSVSFEVAARRCEDLGLLPRGGTLALHDSLKKQFGSPEKRADDLGLPPRAEIQFPVVPPRLLNEAIRKINEGSISIGRASTILNLSIPDIVAVHSGFQ